ncbi:uncharacterized protein THITE_2114666 [Thermothielavioides terrestris NRRL 8126]|uniref:G-protein coupled receptors family 1 profile domain-containing protein n=1 Tax=Thermothielavioides terrestris (strain ATCC 38088 / NRRL 8126) TaxID=578455 RepID=G2R129_THETT|nr:uncharacterized protein THITE_2114666 [Thermothielavioides terrestris NRRL 8126]AEO66526.1 hypothetical protein THITE_2114666 [Thermothielavioides terrestris NRRL 8126]
MPLLPILDGGAHALLVSSRQAADVSSTQPTVRMLLILSLTTASVSVLATLSALYWFVKMRRSFRHELILLLIQSDCLRSLVFVVFPIVSFALGRVRSDSAFCQLSGFALALAIESSDIAVLLIAVHSAMYIFRPRAGLYPYRQFAYFAFYLFPVVAASLAFINGNGYENMGHFCYLRTDRRWALFALSWAPRYIVCASIAVIYVFIYLYIRRRMGDYGRRRSEAMHRSQRRKGSNRDALQTRLRNYGLISSASSSRRTSAADTVWAAKDRQRSSSSIPSARLGSARTSVEVAQPRRSSVQWNWTAFNQAQTAAGSRAPLEDTADPISPGSPLLLSPPATYSRRPSQVTIVDEQAESPRVQTRGSVHQLRQPSSRLSHPTDPEPANAEHESERTLLHFPSRLRLFPKKRASSSTQSRTHPTEADSYPMLPFPSITVTATTTTSSSLSSSSSEEDSPTKQRERALRHQLRALLVYPLVYAVVWLFPFVSHVLGYDDNDRAASPPWLLVVSMLSLCGQGAADCALFMLRETPWRFAHGRAFLVALRKRCVWSLAGRWRWWGREGGAGVGRSKEEMLVDGRLARERRQVEVAVERGRAERSAGEGRVAVKEWWEAWDGLGDEGPVGNGVVEGEGREDGPVDEEGHVAVRQEVG